MESTKIKETSRQVWANRAKWVSWTSLADNLITYFPNSKQNRFPSCIQKSLMPNGNLTIYVAPARSFCQIILILQIGCIYFIEKPCMRLSSSYIQIFYTTWKYRFELILSLHIAFLCSMEIQWSPMFCFWRWGGWCTLFASYNLLYIFNSNRCFLQKKKCPTSHI